MIQSPLGLRVLEGPESDCFKAAAKGLGLHLMDRLDAYESAKGWKGPVMRGEGLFAGLTDENATHDITSGLKKQLVTLHITTQQVLDTAGTHNSSLNKNSTIECIYAWMYFMVMKEIESGAKVRPMCMLVATAFESVQMDSLSVFPNINDLQLMERAVDQLAGRQCWMASYAKKNYKAEIPYVATDAGIRSARDYFKNLN